MHTSPDDTTKLSSNRLVISDYSAVTAPPDGFAERVVGVIMKAFVIPEAVNGGVRLFAFTAQATELFDELAADVIWREVFGQGIFIIRRLLAAA